MISKIFTFLTFTFVFSIHVVLAQQPSKPTTAEIYNQLQKLNFVGSVLYVAAHPDDENTRLISFLANDIKARTGYLSLTRGDGGQNLIGTELREMLGAIRTQELIEARKIDGGEQFFSRANDFGYSKNPVETFSIWDKNKVLSDLVWQIRQFQPDVIINRFDHRSPGTTHGHHTASAMLSVEGFGIANDPSIFPDQIKYVKPWQPVRQFFNTSWWFYGSKEKFDAADKTNLMALQIGTFYPLLGKSNQEIAALSRSRHQSQGFGSTGSRGIETEYLELISGKMPANKNNIFDGIDTTWNRLKNGKPIGDIIEKIIKNYNFKDPSLSVSDLVKAYAMIQNLDDQHWKAIKSEEIKKIIKNCCGLFFEAIADKNEITRSEKLNVKCEIINRSEIKVQLLNLITIPNNRVSEQNLILKNNESKTVNLETILGNNIDFTQPYWLKDAATVGMYNVQNQIEIGVPDVVRQLKVSFELKIDNVPINFCENIVYKTNDEVKGEVYKPLDVVPDISVKFENNVAIFSKNQKKEITVKLIALKDNYEGNLKIESQNGWAISPPEIVVKINKKGEEQNYIFEIKPLPKAESFVANAVFLAADKTLFNQEKINIKYSHISNQQILKPATAKFLALDLKITNQKIAYIEGAGDEVPKYLRQMGYDVSILKPENISPENLALFDVVVTGIRAYNTIETLDKKQKILLEFVKNGHTMIVQYNTTGKFVTKDMAPFSLKISHDRVTEENAEVRFLEPKHPILNYPNKISTSDFQNWIQEQGLYYPDSWDAAFLPIISANDTNESPKNSAILVANYGKGIYIYTGLSFFRELPAGVEGAYRLFANLIATKQNQND